MRIKIYIVTYNDSKVINSNLESLFSTNFYDNDVNIYIINNYSILNIDERYLDKITILNNVLSHDNSRGHLSRNWNQSIVNGFGNVKTPNCDILVTCQDDTLWNNDWIIDLIEIHKKYSFYSCLDGDGFCSYTIDAIRKIGLWDERFVGITFQEAEYFLRCLMYNREHSSINDSRHGRILNSEKEIVKRQFEMHRNHNGRDVEYERNLRLFTHKWGIHPEFWNLNSIELLPSKIENHILYPFFENDIDYTGKNYFI